MESEKLIYCQDWSIASMIAKRNKQKRWDIYGISEVLGMGNAEYNKKLFAFDFTELIPINSHNGISYVCLKKDNKWGLLELKGNETVECEWKIIMDFKYHNMDKMLADLKKSKIKEITNKVVTNIPLSKGNKKFIEYINFPLDFGHSTPGKYVEKATKNGETMFQRKIYNSNVDWFDLELPIGQVFNSNRWSNKARIDLIGRLDGVLTLCELKFTPIKSGNAFDAALQLLAYYVMILNNAEKLDNSDVYHTNSKNRSFKWVDFCNNQVILIVMANKEYWGNLGKKNKIKDIALRDLISQLLNENIVIKLREATIDTVGNFSYKDL